jgi:hypothetical protein
MKCQTRESADCRSDCSIARQLFFVDQPRFCARSTECVIPPVKSSPRIIITTKSSEFCAGRHRHEESPVNSFPRISIITAKSSEFCAILSENATWTAKLFQPTESSTRRKPIVDRLPVEDRHSRWISCRPVQSFFESLRFNLEAMTQFFAEKPENSRTAFQFS